MNSSILSKYIEKIYGYAINKTYTREEADELAQEILLTAVKELPKLKNENSFEAWLWGVAKNTTRTFRRYMGKQRAMYSYDTFEDLSFYDDYEFINDEVYEKLREKIAMLSNTYRDIIILYYYDNLPVKQMLVLRFNIFEMQKMMKLYFEMTNSSIYYQEEYYNSRYN